MKTQRSLKEQLKIQTLVVDELKLALKSQEESTEFWHRKVLTTKKLRNTLLSFLVFIPLIYQIVFIEYLDSELYTAIGVGFMVVFPLVLWTILFIKIWDSK